MAFLCGIISPRPIESCEAELDQMLAARVPVRGTVGKWCSPTVGACLGWSTPPGTFCDCLPIWNEKRNILLVFAGTHWGGKDEVVDLKRRGHSIGKSDASYLVHLYEELGATGFCRHLNGSFCGAVVDLRSSEGFIFADRLGTTRLYLRERSGTLYFSTQLAALFGSAPEAAALDVDAAAALLRTGRTQSGRPPVRGVTLFRPAECWSFRSGSIIARESFFSFEEWRSQPYLGRDYFSERLRETLVQTVPKYLRLQQSLALASRDATITRLIMASAEIPQARIPFLATTWSGASIDEVQQLAKACGQECQTVEVVATPEQLCSMLREAFAQGALPDDTLDLGDIALGRLARERLAAVIDTASPVALNGGSPTRPARLIESWLVPVFDAENMHPEPAAPPLAAGANFALQSQVETRSPMLDHELLRLLHRIPPGEDYAMEAVEQILQKVASTPATASSKDSHRQWIWKRFKGSGRESSSGRKSESLIADSDPWLSRSGTMSNPAFLPLLKSLLLERSSVIAPLLRPGTLEDLVRNAVTPQPDIRLKLSRALALELFAISLHIS